ncbi:MAG: hypothetical protein GY696_33735 [Gammaproteobacteria bacterium]|nr:hypothetical protein [Gammaproteobacteria bacterium]
MEIVLAILLLFGGFTLGSISADKRDDELQSAMAMPNRNGVPDSHQLTQAMLQSDPSRCHADRVVIYRDLTLPYHGNIERPAMQICDCEGRDCSYNPSAFPPSLEVRSPDE